MLSPKSGTCRIMPRGLPPFKPSSSPLDIEVKGHYASSTLTLLQSVLNNATAQVYADFSWDHHTKLTGREHVMPVLTLLEIANQLIA